MRRLNTFGTRRQVNGFAQISMFARGALLAEHELPVVVPHRHEHAVVVEVVELVARRSSAACPVR